jgi:hypothetical protein
MRQLPSITNSNLPKEPTAFDKAFAKTESEMTGFNEAFRLVEQTRKYDGGQMDLFPKELFKISPMFKGKLAED